MKPATVGLIKSSNQVEATLTKKLGALGTALVQGNLNGVNFSKISDLLSKLEELNNNIHEASAASSNGMYQGYAGKFLSTALKIGTVVVFLGCAGVVLYEYSQSVNGDGATTGFTATLTAVGTGIAQIINDYCKSHSDTEATELKNNPPRPTTQVDAIKEVFQNIMTMLQKTGEEANDALQKYKAVYPYLPSSIKKVFPDPTYWHMDLINNAQPIGFKATSTDADASASVERDENDTEGSDGEDPQVVVIPGSSNPV